MNSEAASIIAYGIAALCLCFGFAKCQKNDVEVEILKLQLEQQLEQRTGK